MTQPNKVLAIVGPTGSGKTGWAKKIATNFGGKIISVDSRQIYTGMDIGTAKDKDFPQAMIDIVEPGQNFSLAQYQEQTNAIIKEYLDNDILPILVGGTGLYLDAVVYGYEIPELQKESEAVHRELGKLTDNELFGKLQELDPVSAGKIDPNNIRRVIRALEYTLLNDKPFSAQQKKKKPLFETLILGIDVARETLYARVDARVEQMIKEGLVEEVRNLVKKYPTDVTAFNTIGYKEIIDYLQARIELPSAKEKIKTNTHAYIRKQETWFRRNEDICWVKDFDAAEALIVKFLK